MWHDIGANYFWQAEEYEAQEAKDLANKALQCLKKSVTLDPQNFRHWISLGVVAASKGTTGLKIYILNLCCHIGRIVTSQLITVEETGVIAKPTA